MNPMIDADSSLSASETEIVRANREQRRKTHALAKAWLQNFGSLVRQVGLHDSLNAAVRAIIEPLSTNVRELQEGSHSTTFVFAAGHSFCDGVWIRSTGRASETSNQIAAQLRRIKARGFIVHPGISVDALLALANLIRELSRRQPTAPPVTWTDFPIAGIQFIPSDEDESDATQRSRLRKEAFDLFDEGLRATSRSAQVQMDIFARRRQRSLVLRLVQLAEQSVEELLLLTTVRDPTLPTTSHVLMVTILSIALGRLIGLRRIDLVRLGIAALSHNVGESLLPNGLLDQSRQLDDNEIVLLHSHPLIGARHLFETFGFEPQIADRAVACIEHHRWVNGQGYPRLVDHHPHIFSRIIAVTDVFDALCQTRPFRADFPPDQAIKLVGRFAGSQLDLSLVRMLIRLVGKFPPGTLIELDTGEYGIVIGPGNGAQPLNRPRVLLLTDDEGYELEAFQAVDLGERHPRRRAWMRTIMRARDGRTLSQSVSAYLLADRIEVVPERLDIEQGIGRGADPSGG
jgi:HD-GYP domain-containing protein (c-di-GMP phosphodiesterase class II)